MNKKEVIPKFKFVEYKDETLFYANNIDVDKLDEFSEFEIGSITKIFTLIVLLLLQQNKLLDIIDVAKYLTGFPNIKIIDLLQHKAGLIR